jgi:hypothetical protein
LTTGDAFRSIQASWVIPSISCPGESSPGYNGSAWFGVGLGRSYPQSEQVVTEAFCTGTVASYVAYLEVGGVQAAGSAGGLPLHAGDRISASVSYAGIGRIRAGPQTYRAARYHFQLSDQTERRSFGITDTSDCLRHACDHSSAEVSAGIPFAGYSPLADYGSVTFSHVTITDVKGHRGAFSPNKRWRVAKLVELDTSAHVRAASPSALRRRGTQFSDFWHAY